MNLKRILGVSLLAATMGIATVASVGLAMNSAKEAVEVSATAKSITIDLSIHWAEAKAKYSVNFIDSTHNVWSSITEVESGVGLATVSYDFDWTPDKMIAVRYNPDKSDSDIESHRWDEGYKWNQTQDLTTFGSHIRITDWGWGEVNDFAVIKGGPSGGSWSDKAILNNLKVGFQNHCEYYKDNVTLVAGESFKSVFAGEYYGYYSIGDGVASDEFSGGKGNDINILKGGTYSLFFDATTHNVHIANPTVAAADEWAEDFNDNLHCDDQGRTIPDNWGTFKTKYLALTEAAQKYIGDADAKTAEQGGTEVEQAMARYDYAVANHDELKTAANNYVITSGGGPRDVLYYAPIPHSIFGGDNQSLTISIIVIVTAISLTSIGTLVFLKKRKHQ